MGRAWISGDATDYEERASTVGCASKRRFTGIGEAKSVRRAMRDSHLAIYACRFCGGYHIGHHTGNDKVKKYQTRETRYERSKRYAAKAYLRDALAEDTPRQRRRPKPRQKDEV